MFSSCLESLEDQFSYPHNLVQQVTPEMAHIIWDVPPGLAERTLWIPAGLSREWGCSLLKMLCLQHSLLQNSHGTLQECAQSFMDSSRVAPCLRLQLPQSCSSLAPLPSTQLFRSCLISLFPTVFPDRLDVMTLRSHLRMNSLCSSYRTAVADIPLSCSHAVSCWTRRNSLVYNSLVYPIAQTWHFTSERGEFDQRRCWSTPAQQDTHTEAEDRLQPCQLLCYFLPEGQIRVQSDSNDMWLSLHETGLGMGLGSWTKPKPSSTPHSQLHNWEMWAPFCVSCRKWVHFTSAK